MILLTGSSGKTGHAILRALRARNATVRAVVRRPDQMESVTAAGAAEAVVADLRDLASLMEAARGVNAVYHVPPNVQPDELQIALNVMQAALENGVSRFVYHSVLHPQTRGMSHHWNKLLVEDRLLETPLAWTILQPAAYYQNVLGQLKTVRETGVFAQPYAVETRTSMVDLADVAEVAAKVLTEPGFEYGIFELCGPDLLSQAEVAEALARQLGRPVTATVTPRDEWERRVRAGGMDDYSVRTLLAMFEYYERFGFTGNPFVLRSLLGRAPTRFDSFVARELAGLS